MKIKINNNLLSLSCIYIFIVLYTQIAEIFLSFSITKVYFIYLVFTIFYNLVNKVIKYTLSTIFIFTIGVVYCIYYFLECREVFNYAYSFVIITLITNLLIKNNFKIKKNSINIINKYICIYLIINILLYLFKVQQCFQIAGKESQFRGALPHSNMLGAVMISFFIIQYRNKGKVVWINRILISFLVLTTMSRTYILILMALWLVLIAGLLCPDINFGIKFFIGIIILLCCGESLFNIFVMYIPSLRRFKTLRFSSNGRQWLQTSYYDVIENGSSVDWLLGFPMVKKYLEGISIEFSHSFTENSYIGVFLLFGLVGVVWLLCFAMWFLRHCNGIESLLVVIISITSLISQDTLLSVQNGILLIVTIIIFTINISKASIDSNYSNPIKYQ